jgi:hypothetical protein
MFVFSGGRASASPNKVDAQVLMAPLPPRLYVFSTDDFAYAGRVFDICRSLASELDPKLADIVDKDLSTDLRSLVDLILVGDASATDLSRLSELPLPQIEKAFLYPAANKVICYVVRLPRGPRGRVGRPYFSQGCKVL